MKDEKELYQKLKELLHPCDFVRIENGVGMGIPDINACFQGSEIWIEAKMWLEQGGVLLRKFQHAWCLRRHSHGGVVFVVAYDDRDIDQPQLMVWKYKDVTVMPCGDYLRITTTPSIIFYLDQKRQLKDYLFDI